MLDKLLTHVSGLNRHLDLGSRVALALSALIGTTTRLGKLVMLERIIAA